MTDNRGRQRSRDARVPPHSIEAEVALLGSALISATAIEAISSVSVGDYYLPAHQHIAHAIEQLVDAGEPVDAVTVSDRLSREGLLEEIGGIHRLLDLQANTPAISRAAHYARIVRDTATLRRLISASAEVAELAYLAPDDPTEAISRASAMIAALSTSEIAELSNLTIPDMAALLAGDIRQELPVMMTRSDGSALLYAGKMHMFQAEPSSGKTWLAVYAVDEVLRAGGAAVVVDYEDTATGFLGRLLAGGARPADIGERFRYVHPDGPFGPAERRRLFALVEELNADLVVIDGVGESLTRQGLSEDKATDWNTWSAMLPRPLAETGAAVLMLDHVAKDPEQRGRWARGTGAKLGTIDGVSYHVKIRRAFSRQKAGQVDLVVAKDRPGGVGAIGETAAVVSIEPHANGERVVMRVDPYTAEKAATDSWKPTVLMGRVFEAISSTTVPLTATAVRAMVHGKPALVAEALQRLIAEGYIGESSGRPRTLSILRHYTPEAEPSTSSGRSAPAPPPAPLFDPDEIPPPDDDPSSWPTAEDEADYYDQLGRTYFNHPEF